MGSIWNKYSSNWKNQIRFYLESEIFHIFEPNELLKASFINFLTLLYFSSSKKTPILFFFNFPNFPKTRLIVNIVTKITQFESLNNFF